MKFLKNTRWFAKPTLDTLFSELQGWYTYEEFGETLKKEQNRSDRTGLPFAYVQIDLASYGATQDTSAPDILNFLRQLTEIVEENTRNYDIKFITRSGVIGILLIDTSMDGAKLFIEKISTILFIRFKELGEETYRSLLGQVTISTYPLTRIFDENGPLENRNVPVYLKNLKFESRKTASNGISQNDNMFRLQWEAAPRYNGDSLALQENTLITEIYKKSQKPLTYKAVKRLMDILGALFAILLTLPIMTLIAIVIKLTSKGPVFFKQERVGEFCSTFTMFKFRSMRCDADDSIHREHQEKLIRGEVEAGNGQAETPVFKVPNDPRITAIGKIIRKTNLDELPQFFNILFGQMSFVGPRPPISYEVKNYHPWHLRRVLEAKPGLTGLWQINRTAETTFSDMVRYDLYYINNQTLWMDIRIISRTLVTFLINGFSG